MLDIKLIRDTPNIVEADLQKRGDPDKLAMLQSVIDLDIEWRRLLVEVDDLKANRNTKSKCVSRLAFLIRKRPTCLLGPD